MDTLLGLRTWHWRATDWTAAAVSGFAAGAVLMVLDLVWSTLFSAEGTWRTSHMIAPLFIGNDALKSSGFGFSVTVVSVALAIHYAIGVLFGLVMGGIMVQLHLDESLTSALGSGAIMGMVLYLVNFEGLALLLPWLAEMRGGETMAAHVVFGIVTATLYWRLKRTPREA